ncbi:MAG: diadenylate cyclase CdaA [Myxococcota bacterium]
MVNWLWETLSIVDVIDILLMAYILYRALRIIQGTRAIQSLLGLGSLVVLYALSDQLGLTSINWLLERFFVYIVLAVLILFQDDIRRGLARAGSFLPSFRPNSDLPMLQELVKVSFIMGSRRLGALIALERNALLAEYVEPATPLDALVSQELILSIFHPTSPLHDGAVVIQKGRIAAAQVFLPLSLSKDVSRFYGTRHRAAIGLTEATDAVVIIVSEERGTVSLVMNGQVTPMKDANELRQQLQELFQPTEETPQRLETA